WGRGVVAPTTEILYFSFFTALPLQWRNLFPNEPSHLSAAHGAEIFLLNIKRTIAAVQNRFDGTLDPISRFGLVQRMAQQHRNCQNRRQRIGLILACDIRRGAMNRLVNSRLAAQSVSEQLPDVPPPHRSSLVLNLSH